MVGAQVGYRDLAGFGRRFIDVAPNELADDIVYQIGALDGMCRVAGTAVRYVKPHGALYNAIVHHEAQAAAVVAAVRDYSAELPVLGLPGSAFLRAAEKAGLRTVRRVLRRPRLHPGGRRWCRARRRAPCCTIRPRSRRGCSGSSTRAWWRRSTAATSPSQAESACVHGDSPGAVEMARAVRDGLAAAGVTVRAFA